MFCAAIVSLTIVLLFVSAFILLKDVPSIHNHNQPFCKKDGLSVEERYLGFDELPKNALRVFSVAEPFYKNALVNLLASEMSQVRHPIWNFRGMLLHLWLEKYEEKDLIEFYLNSGYFGNGCYGISAAAKEFFHKEFDLLNIEETAQLIALLRSPSAYSITEHPEKNKERADYILNKLQEQEPLQVPTEK